MIRNFIPVCQGIVGIELNVLGSGPILRHTGLVDATEAITVMDMDRRLEGKATRSRQRHAAGAGALPMTLLDHLAVNAHLTAILAGLKGDIHAIDPAREVCEILRREAIRRHQRSVRYGMVEVVGELLLGRTVDEMLQAREGVLVRLGLGEGEVDVVGAGGEMGEGVGVRVGCVLEIKEFVHLVDCGHSEGAR